MKKLYILLILAFIGIQAKSQTCDSSSTNPYRYAWVQKQCFSKQIKLVYAVKSQLAYLDSKNELVTLPYSSVYDSLGLDTLITEEFITSLIDTNFIATRHYVDSLVATATPDSNNYVTYFGLRNYLDTMNPYLIVDTNVVGTKEYVRKYADSVNSLNNLQAVLNRGDSASGKIIIDSIRVRKVYVDTLRAKTGASITIRGNLKFTSDTLYAIGDTLNRVVGDGIFFHNQVSITTSTSITTNTKSTVLRLLQNGRVTVINNGASPINITCDTSSGNNFVASYILNGTGAVTFTAGTGATVTATNGTAILLGALGSTASVSRIGNIFYVAVNNK